MSLHKRAVREEVRQTRPRRIRIFDEHALTFWRHLTEWIRNFGSLHGWVAVYAALVQAQRRPKDSLCLRTNSSQDWQPNDVALDRSISLGRGGHGTSGNEAMGSPIPMGTPVVGVLQLKYLKRNKTATAQESTNKTSTGKATYDYIIAGAEASGLVDSIGVSEVDLGNSIGSIVKLGNRITTSLTHRFHHLQPATASIDRSRSKEEDNTN
ncbi:hypothetical protein NM208_g17109 [Fusarium decemcellulare]|uniref:Uncharacterized protein n=1 Tax=Fusarium decemcellulare TaxID=57161 RepID=A0ACC1RA14_9HYPO|nr:hypothetical protein NM208_g17109 [Fusarium decemcellulare]